MKHGPLSYGLVAVSSAGLGLGIGVLLCRHLVNRQHEEQLAYEIRSLKAHYERRAADLEKFADDRIAEYERRASNDAIAQLAATSGNGEFDVAGGQDLAGEPETAPSRGSAEGRQRVENLIHRLRYDHVIDPAAHVRIIKPVEVGEESVGDDTGPHVVSVSAFCEDNPEWQRIFLTYYAADGVLSDDKEQIVEDILGVVGEDLPGKFGGVSQDPHSAYIRNTRLESYFEVSLNEGSYAELVLGEVGQHPYPELPEEEPVRESHA